MNNDIRRNNFEEDIDPVVLKAIDSENSTSPILQQAVMDDAYGSDKDESDSDKKLISNKALILLIILSAILTVFVYFFLF